MNREKGLLRKIQAGDHGAVEIIYNKYRKEFLIYTSRFAIHEDEAIDIYQDSIIVLYENIISGKLTSLTSSLKTYLFAIGKYKVYNHQRVKVMNTDFSDCEFLLKEEEDEFSLQEENIEKMQRAYRELGKRCQKVLKLFYYENRSLEEIKNLLNYASRDVVKSQKSRCIKQLKNIILSSK